MERSSTTTASSCPIVSVKIRFGALYSSGPHKRRKSCLRKMPLLRSFYISYKSSPGTILYPNNHALTKSLVGGRGLIIAPLLKFSTDGERAGTSSCLLMSASVITPPNQPRKVECKYTEGPCDRQRAGSETARAHDRLAPHRAPPISSPLVSVLQSFFLRSSI